MKSGVCIKKGVPPEASIFLLNYIEFSKEKGIFQKVMIFHGIKFKRIDIQIVAYLKKLWKKEKQLFIIIIFYDFKLWILAESVFLLEIFILNKNHSLLSNPLIFPKTKILISIWSQRTEKIPYPRCGFGACLRCEWAS